MISVDTEREDKLHGEEKIHEKQITQAPSVLFVRTAVPTVQIYHVYNCHGT